jgi:hypothetical protein
VGALEAKFGSLDAGMAQVTSLVEHDLPTRVARVEAKHHSLATVQAQRQSELGLQVTLLQEKLEAAEATTERVTARAVKSATALTLL